MAKRHHALPRVAVLGGGFAGLEAAFHLRKRLGRSVELTLVSDRDEFLFKPNTIYIPFGTEPDQFYLPLASTLEHRGIRFVHGRAEGVEPKDKMVATSAGTVPYDYLIVATGAAMRSSEVPGLAEYADTIWNPDEMLRLRSSFDRIVRVVQGGFRQKVVFLVPPNNKCSGPLYEMVLMLDTWLRRKRVRGSVELVYVTYERSYVQAFGPRLHDVITEEFTRREINGQVRRRVTRVDKNRAYFDDGSFLFFDQLVSFPPYVAATRYDGLPSDERGFLRTDPCTRAVSGHEDIYAVGDAGDFPVKQAFLALLQADAASEQIAQRIRGEEPAARFDPVSMCIMEQLDKATFAQVPLRLTGDPELPVAVRPDDPEMYRVGSGEVWRFGKKLLGATILGRFRHGQPFHAGATWTVLESGVKAMSTLFAD